MTEKLTLGRTALDAILAHARELYPDECCGAVVVAGGRDEVRRFTNIQRRLHQENPVDFPRDATTAYTPEPRELLDAIRAGEQPGARLAVFYHSHSKNGAYFSGEDRARAMFDGDPAYPEVTYLVVSDERERGEARVFRWDEGTHDFVEVELAVTEAAPKRAAPAKRRPKASAKPAAKVKKGTTTRKLAGKRPTKTKPATRTVKPVRAKKKPAAKPRRGAAKRPRAKARPRRKR